MASIHHTEQFLNVTKLVYKPQEGNVLGDKYHSWHWPGIKHRSHWYTKQWLKISPLLRAFDNNHVDARKAEVWTERQFVVTCGKKHHEIVSFGAFNFHGLWLLTQSPRPSCFFFFGSISCIIDGMYQLWAQFHFCVVLMMREFAKFKIKSLLCLLGNCTHHNSVLTSSTAPWDLFL